MGDWYVYLLRCSDNTLYTGITTDVARRIREHNDGGPLGARYTRNKRPVRLMYQEPAKSRSHATLREYEIKRLSREQKEAFIRKSEGKAQSKSTSKR